MRGQNNGLEGTNWDIKANKLVRQKQKLGDFISNALSIVHKFRIKPDERLFCDKSELISLAMQTKGYQWLMNHQRPQDIMKVGSSLFVLSTQAKVGTDLKSNVKNICKAKTQESTKVLTIGNF